MIPGVEEVRACLEGMKARAWLLEVKGADHGTSVKQKAGTQPVRAEVGAVAVRWLESRDEAKRYCAVAWDAEERCVVSEGWEMREKTTNTKKSAKKKKKA